MRMNLPPWRRPPPSSTHRLIVGENPTHLCVGVGVGVGDAIGCGCLLEGFVQAIQHHGSVSPV